MTKHAWVLLSALLGVGAASAGDAAMEIDVPVGTPTARIDLRTREGIASVEGDWRFHDTTIRQVPFHAVGADRKPTGPANQTYDYEPHAGGADFDDAGWEVLDPTTLEARRSTGKLCFAWYRVHLRLPERIDGRAIEGSTIVFSTTVDDYAEVWVDGQLPRTLGQSGGSMIAGWNAPNRVVLTRDAHSGQSFQIAIFAANGPISDTPENYIWMRSAALEVYASSAPRLAVGSSGGVIDRRDASLDHLLAPGTQVEKLADGFSFGEGPLWLPEGALLFSDPNTNVIYRWREGEGVSTFREKSGYAGDDINRYRQPGSNGLALDREGRLTLCQHGNRRIVRIEADGREVVLADRYQGARLNSPNDLVYRSDGTLYFTDPYFGLPGFAQDPARETPWSGIYCWKDGELTLLDRSLDGPNGLAFSPDEKHLYVGNWDITKKWIVRYPVKSDGSLGKRELFFDLTNAPGEEALDGLKVDREGNVYASGPGGLWIISAKGKLLGRLSAPELPANFAWGDVDGRSLYLTARSGLYRVRVGVPGAAFATASPMLGDALRP